MSCTKDEVASLEMIDSVKFDLLQVPALGRMEFEQALRDFLRDSEDITEREAFDIPTPARILEAELVGVSDKIGTGRGESGKLFKSRDSQRAPKVSKIRRSVTPPPGLENPMKIHSERLASTQDDWEAGGTQWHEQVPKHVQIGNEPALPNSPTMKARFCTQCGQKVEDALAKARFCTFCGCEHPNIDALHQQAANQFEGAGSLWQNFMTGSPPTMDNCNTSPWYYDNNYGGSVYGDEAWHHFNFHCMAR